MRGWQKYAVFAGRASRSEYWWWTLLVVIISIAFEIVDFAIAGDLAAYWNETFFSAGALPSMLWSLATLIPSLSVGVRRLHDTNRSGWWLLIGIIPLVGWVILIVLLAAAPAGRRSLASSSR